MSIRAALDAMLGIHNRQMNIERPDLNLVVAVKATPSNYSRNLQGPEQVVVDGKEFVISKHALDTATFPCPPKRGDRLVDPDLGDMSIVEVREMFDLGGAIIAYRIRVG